MRKLIQYLALSVIIVSANATLAQNVDNFAHSADEIFGTKKEICFTFTVTDKQTVNNDLTHIISIDKVIPVPNSQGYQVRAYANKKEFAEFLSRHISYTLVKPTNAGKAYNMATTTAQMSTWDRYPTYSVYLQMMADFASIYPSICKIDTVLAATPDGRAILSVKISDNVNSSENEPRFLYTSSIHGDETTGYYLMLRLINYMLTNYGVLPKITNLVNNVEVWICPLSNPDGTYASGDATINATSSTRANGLGVDMNRNYPDPDTGPHPDGNAWQPETQAFMAFASLHHFNASANFHGGAEVLNYPWDDWITTDNPNAEAPWWERVCTAYVDTTRLITPTYLADVVADGVSEGGDWYIITGGRQDYMNFFQYCREVTIELDAEKTTQTQNLPGMWNTNYRSLLNFIQESLYGIRGLVTDSCTGLPLKAKVWISTHDQANDSSQVYSFLPVGDYHKYIIAGTYNVTYSAPGYASKTVNGVTVTNGNSIVVNVSLAPNLPVASFTADVTSTCSGLVNFTDLSTGGPTNWSWNFGDSFGSTSQSPTHVYTSSGTYTVSLTATNCKGGNTMTKNAYITVNLQTPPTATGDTVCVSQTASLTATAPNSIKWYDAQTGGNLLFTGPNFVTPQLSGTTTYYVGQEASSSQYVGKVDSVGGGMMYTNAQYYLIFNCTTACTLNSVKVYAGAAGNRTIELQNSSGVTLSSVTPNISAGVSRVQLGFPVPVGTNLRLTCTTTNPNMYRNSGGITFPYNLVGKISITGTNAASTRYYFFYDWEIDRSVCASPLVPVIAMVTPAADASFTQSTNGLAVTFTNTSSYATSYLWKFGDGASSTQTDPLHTYASDGTYNVVLIATNLCGVDSVTTPVTVTTVGGITFDNEAGFVLLHPNPSHGALYFDFPGNAERVCQVDVISLLGEKLKAAEIHFVSNNAPKMLDLSGLEAGIYFVKLTIGHQSVVRKIVIE